jgi:hypothetical protein
MDCMRCIQIYTRSSVNLQCILVEISRSRERERGGERSRGEARGYRITSSPTISQANAFV